LKKRNWRRRVKKNKAVVSSALNLYVPQIKTGLGF
jgi:hypothetical protein